MSCECERRAIWNHSSASFQKEAEARFHMIPLWQPFVRTRKEQARRALALSNLSPGSPKSRWGEAGKWAWVRDSRQILRCGDSWVFRAFRRRSFNEQLRVRWLENVSTAANENLFRQRSDVFRFMKNRAVSIGRADNFNRLPKLQFWRVLWALYQNISCDCPRILHWPQLWFRHAAKISPVTWNVDRSKFHLLQ